MKKKGFTLIELLAVIVVLAIIALIATPIVMNTIKEVEKRSIERGTENYLRQVETAIAVKRMDGIKVNDGIYKINQDGNICLDSECKDLLEIEMNGTKPSSGEVVIEGNNISTTSIIKYDDYIVLYNDKENIYKAKELYKGILCTANTEKVSSLIYGGSDWTWDSSTFINQEVGQLASEVGPYTMGVTYTCDLGDGEEKVFFILEDGDTTNLTKGSLAQPGEVSLIMKDCIDENGNVTTEFVGVAWSEDGSNHRDEESQQAITVKEELKKRTENWTKLDETRISLPSANQITEASGYTNWDSITQLHDKVSPWLMSRFFYWTSTPWTPSNNFSWAIGPDGIIGVNNVSKFNNIRPVITISKSQLN